MMGSLHVLLLAALLHEASQQPVPPVIVMNECAHPPATLRPCPICTKWRVFEFQGNNLLTVCSFSNHSHAEALSAWFKAAADTQLPPAPYAVLHVDRHSDMNTPSSMFISTPVSQYDIDSDAVAERSRLAQVQTAAVHEADLASFQMVGVWAGVVSSIAWIFGNSSEPFLLTLNGEREAECSGLACPLREWLQSDKYTGYFAVIPRDKSASDASAPHSVWQQGDGSAGGFHTQDVSRHSFDQTPLLPSAPFDFWLGHIDHPTTLSNAHQALSTPLDVGVPNQLQKRSPTARDQVSWVLDIDLDAFMPSRFSHRSPPWSYGGQLDGCSQYLYHSLCHRWSSPAGENCTLWQYVAQLFHDSEQPRSTAAVEPDVADSQKAQAKGREEANGLSQQCKNDILSLRERWRQLVKEDAALGAAGKRLSPPELLLWMQAYDHASPTALAEGESTIELLSKADLAHLPRFLSRIESLLRGLHAPRHPKKATAAPVAGFGPPAAITIARSTDGFAAIETIPYIEKLVVDMLDRLYARKRRALRAGTSEYTAAGGISNDRRASMVTQGGLQVHYTDETATLNDLQTMVRRLLPPD